MGGFRGKRRTIQKGWCSKGRDSSSRSTSDPSRGCPLTKSGSKAAGPDLGKSHYSWTVEDGRGTSPPRAHSATPTAGLWLIPLCPGLFQSLIPWPEASLSQPRDIPQREHAGEASGVSRARGTGTAQASPGGTSGVQPCPGHVTGVLTSPGTRAQTSALGVWTCPLSQALFLTSVCPPRPTEHQPAP